jgi:hypothetical protein
MDRFATAPPSIPPLHLAAIAGPATHRSGPLGPTHRKPALTVDQALSMARAAL